MSNALEFAINAHGRQKYGSGPYVKHLDDVVNVLKEFGNFDQALLDAAYLHDVLEDTPCQEEELYIRFSEESVDLVKLVTDKPGKNRAERHEATYPAIAQSPKAVTLKLADRIANIRSNDGNQGFLKMYRKEYPYFRETLRGNHHGAMWAELDRLMLCF